MKLLYTWLAATLLASTAAAQAIDPAATAALPGVKAAALEAHVRYLADDALRGRLPGTPGYQVAVDYTVKQLKAVGVQPAGDKGTFTQTVRMRRAFADLNALLDYQGATAGPALVQGQDVVFYPNPQLQQVEVNLGLVFVGYGISAPDLGYDDYAGVEAAGKIVVVTRQALRQFSLNERQYFSDLRTIIETAANHGAAGVLLASSHAAPLPTLAKGLVSVLGPDGKVAVSRSYAPGSAQVVASISAATLQRLFTGAARDTGRTLAALRAGRPAAQELPGRLHVRTRSRYQDFTSYNVVGKIVGSDSGLRNEYVVHSAHLDHLGVGEPIKGDSIYNGAHDNATGVASVLEIARLYAGLNVKPRRSVLLVLVTGEEMGLLGSAYFAQFPTVPAASLVADINTDMPTLIAPLLSVVPLGADHSSLTTAVAQATAYLGLPVEPDPEPTQNRFIRSDQYSFVLQGIPALHFKYGNKTANGKNNLSETVQTWRAATYHKPQDDMSGTFDWQAGVKFVQLNFLTGYQAAQAPERPRWNKGDFFGRRFGRSE
ncbi:MAG: M28 family peptidase [Janthinobacterium lividum]